MYHKPQMMLTPKTKTKNMLTLKMRTQKKINRMLQKKNTEEECDSTQEKTMKRNVLNIPTMNTHITKETLQTPSNI